MQYRYNNYIAKPTEQGKSKYKTKQICIYSFKDKGVKETGRFTKRLYPTLKVNFNLDIKK